ncbi:GNAT family N-acetyltransferase [Sphingomonas jatrophae]|uniref:Protein N-acetyltransferase, RimJ/RimL family n=1 Tax=Sphingomonas jatrophae TaxID=1166337 RepID=A0A1I6JQE5_9SPHN|nr:GNAT family protein [Sphingomonas jatrophae]SFR81196.1 Protein N-acetyltransferase, RimJ/RimL family [Sphingomonas jatrophae]
MLDVARLHVPLRDGTVRLEPLTERHRDALREACAADAAIWEIYLNSWALDCFDVTFDALLANPARQPFAIVEDGKLVGMTAWINAEPRHRTVELGNTYLAPAARGTGLNGRVKRLLLDHGFALGLLRVQFVIDVRNERSQAAVLKLGARPEGVIRNHYVTWTGHRRSSALFSIVAGEWPHA